MSTGTVKMFNSAEGWGFIVPDFSGGNQSQDLFVHISQVDDTIETLRKGDRVKFTEGVSARNQKPEAKDVSLAGDR